MSVGRFLKSNLGVGILIMVSGFALTFFLGRSATLTCTPAANSQVSCTSQSRLLGLFPVGKHTMPEVQEVRVDEQCSEEDCSYCITPMSMSGEALPYQQCFGTYDWAKEAADKIIALRHEDEGSAVAFMEGLPLVPVCFGGAWILFGLFVILGSARSGRLMEEVKSQETSPS
jgi:hypothetical protein